MNFEMLDEKYKRILCTRRVTHELNPIESMRKFRIHRLYSDVYVYSLSF